MIQKKNKWREEKRRKKKVAWILYAELVQAETICASVPLDHAKLVVLVLAGRGSATNVPFLRAHGLVESFRGTIGAAAIPVRSAGYRVGGGLGLGRGGAVIRGRVLSGGLEVAG